jgi:hypothetical protein
VKRIIEFWAMVEDHNLYDGDELIIDWHQHDKGFFNNDIVALCSDGNLFWVELPSSREIDDFIFWL